ncbi:hypothetical protein MAPG_05172 [Magnaporthiopsis poae ATCC 64411]|uniref:C2H2-type domain-containing protein n=1 Tax=Magnaporthiopsis poae (strain ATCC 64411 / 73-15) TaxID=644358 RepID=A0A0C4DYP6_MAGP6|nr:hypothetical protein MAPG_05172 [Magnaporthiopsis poae ATCC 64411]
MTQTISNHVIRSLAAFRALVEPGNELSFQQPWIPPRIKDEQTKFKVWAGNIGAHKTGTSSLDYRLRDASPIKDEVVSLLEELVDLLDQAAAIATGEKTPWDELEDEEPAEDPDSGLPITELGQIVSEGIADVVDCLLRLSTTIRNPAPHDRFAATHPADASHFEPWDIQHVQSKFPTIEPWLADRLGKAISMRRQYLRYRESHHAKLSQGLDDPDHAGNERDYTVASSIPEDMKDRPTAKPAIFEDDRSDAGASETSYATSVANSNALKIPPMPEKAHAGPFQCPFCYMMIMATDRVAWKKHVYSDLRPYICLEKECMASSSEQEFSRRHEWMRHVQKTHWHVYPCLLGCTSVLSSPSAYRSHLSKAHPSSLAQGDIDALVRLAAQPLDIEAGIPCPLCSDGEILRSKKEYRRHVSRHQEQLSLFALPRNPDDDDDDAKGHSDGTSEDGSADSVIMPLSIKTDTVMTRVSLPDHLSSVSRADADSEGHTPPVEHSVDEAEDRWAEDSEHYGSEGAQAEELTPAEGDASSVKSIYGEDVVGRGRSPWSDTRARSRSPRRVLSRDYGVEDARPEKPIPAEGETSSVKSVEEVPEAVAGEIESDPMWKGKEREEPRQRIEGLRGEMVVEPASPWEGASPAPPVGESSSYPHRPSPAMVMAQPGAVVGEVEERIEISPRISQEMVATTEVDVNEVTHVQRKGWYKRVKGAAKVLAKSGKSLAREVFEIGEKERIESKGYVTETKVITERWTGSREFEEGSPKARESILDNLGTAQGALYCPFLLISGQTITGHGPLAQTRLSSRSRVLTIVLLTEKPSAQSGFPATR